LEIRIIKDDEIETMVEMMHRVCKTVFPSYYPQEFIDATINDLSVENEKGRIEKSHFYVAVDVNEKIIGCGAISYFWEDTNDSIIRTIFVDTEHQQKGIGRKIVETLENDEIYKCTERTHVFSSIPGLPVYRHLGYEFEDNKVAMDSHGYFRLLKTHLGRTQNNSSGSNRHTGKKPLSLFRKLFNGGGKNV